MGKINKIRIYANDNDSSLNALDVLTSKLLENNFEIVNNNEDLSIAIGGDGSFLRMIKSCSYSSDLIYVGVNAGTLGFLQEIKIEDIDMFISSLNNNTYKIENIGIQETTITTEDDIYSYYTLNEILIREKELNTAMLDILVDDAPLERFVGDGLLIATSVGSTAYNMSFGGSIVYNSLHTLQITPIAPLNSKAYRNLLNSLIIPESIVIEIKPNKNKNSLIISIDGDNKIFDNVKSIKTVVLSKRIKCLRLENYNFFDKINDKFLN